MKKGRLFNHLNLDDILNRFIDEHSNEEVLQELNKRKIRECIEAPFSYLRENLKNNRIYIQRHSYFLTFYTTIKRAKSALKDVEKKYKEGRIEKNKYIEVKEMIEDFLKRKDNGSR